MVLQYFYYLYYKLKYYLYPDNRNYAVPFDIEEIENEKNFYEYQNNNEVNKTLFALNNMPEIVYQLIFKDMINVSPNYYYIRMDDQNINHNLETLKDDMLNDNIQYIFIRLNIIQHLISHVNGIIINKNQNYVLIYEPKVVMIYDPIYIEEFLKLKGDFSNYKFILAQDIGYTCYNRMQNYDLFCQTYVLFVFILITLNDNINYVKYRKMFNTIINYNNLGYFLYYINTLLTKNNYTICNQQEIWAYPTHKFKNISNIINFFFYNKKEELEENDIDIIEENDMFIIDFYNTNLGCSGKSNGTSINGIFNEFFNEVPPSTIPVIGTSVEND